MSRNRTPRPTPQIVPLLEAGLVVARELAAAATAISEALNGIAAAVRDAGDAVPVIQPPERLTARGIGAEHLGRWISLESPSTGADGLSLRPAGVSGRLVGIREAVIQRAKVEPTTDSTRTRLIIQQGPELLHATVKLTDVVRVGTA